MEVPTSGGCRAPMVRLPSFGWRLTRGVARRPPYVGDHRRPGGGGHRRRLPDRAGRGAGSRCRRRGRCGRVLSPVRPLVARPGLGPVRGRRGGPRHREHAGLAGGGRDVLRRPRPVAPGPQRAPPRDRARLRGGGHRRARHHRGDGRHRVGLAVLDDGIRVRLGVRGARLSVPARPGRARRCPRPRRRPGGAR